MTADATAQLIPRILTQPPPDDASAQESSISCLSHPGKALAPLGTGPRADPDPCQSAGREEPDAAAAGTFRRLVSYRTGELMLEGDSL